VLFLSARRTRLLAGFVALVAGTALGFMRFVDGAYTYNLSAKALSDPSGTYGIEMTLPNGQVVTASFALKP
jgi:hypothetical protein